jgi:hypothetical protein
MGTPKAGLLAGSARACAAQDGGTTWTLVFPSPRANGMDIELHGLSCLPEKSGPCYAFGAEYRPSSAAAPSYARNDTDLEHPRVAWPVIYRSAGPGSNWEKLNARLEGFIVEDLHFFSETDAAILTDSAAFWSHDSGSHWQASPGLVPEEGGLATSTWRGAQGWAAYRDGGFFPTDNRGRTWQRAGRAGQNGDLATLLSMLPAGLGAAVTSMRTLQETSDGGRDWRPVRREGCGLRRLSPVLQHCLRVRP